MKKNIKTNGGFTLIEILIVIGIIAILAAIVLVAVNPARQFAKANDTQRSANVNAILNAVGQYIIDQKGSTSTLPALTSTAQTISNSGYNVCALLVSTYIAALPIDPKTGNYTDCTNYNTGYTIKIDAATQRTITITAPATEATTTPISVSR